jgi:hypothetical protein
VAKPSDIFDHQDGSIRGLNLADITHLKERGAGIQNEVMMGEKVEYIHQNFYQLFWSFFTFFDDG